MIKHGLASKKQAKERIKAWFGGKEQEIKE
jgi:hypothetical protein